MTAISAERSHQTFSSIMEFFRWPAILSLTALLSFAIYLAFYTMFTQINESGAAGFVLFIIFGGIATLVGVVGTLGVISDGDAEKMWEPPACIAGALWAIIGSYFLIWGTTFPVEANTARVTHSGDIYYAGEEVPRGVIWRNSVPVSPTGTVTVEVPWSDRGVNSGATIAFVTTITLVASFSEDREAVESEIRATLAQNDSLQGIGDRLWSRSSLSDTDRQRVQELVPQQGIEKGQTFPISVSWATPFQVTDITNNVTIGRSEE